MAHKTGKTQLGKRRRWSAWPCAQCGTVVEIGAYYKKWQAGEISKEIFDATRTHCPNCGSAKSAKAEGEEYQDPSATVLITDKDSLDRTAKGANVPCEYCEGESTVIDVDGKPLRSCVNCGAGMDGRDYADGPLPDAKPVRPSPPPLRPPPAPRRAAEPTRSRRPAPAPLYDDPGPVRVDGDPFAKIMVWGGALLAVVLIVWMCIHFFGKHETVAQVDSIGWEITHVLKERKVHTGSDWESDMPMNTYAESCTNTYKETVDCTHITCNPHPENVGLPYPCNCSMVPSGDWQENEDGSQTEILEEVCTDMCQDTETVYDACHPGGDEVYEDWCDYKYDTWPEKDRKTTRGSDHNLTPPTLVARGSDQKLDKSQTLTVKWSDPEGAGGPWTDHPSDVGQFRRYNVGDQWVVDYNRAGTIWPKQNLSTQR